MSEFHRIPLKILNYNEMKRNETKKNQVKPNPRPGVLTAFALFAFRRNGGLGVDLKIRISENLGSSI